MNCNTQKGLYFIIIGSIITMIYSIIKSISSFFTQDAVTSMIIGIFGIVSFIGVILILIGALLFLMGRKEFGKKHQKNIMNAVIIFVINVFAILSILTIVIAIMIYSAITKTISTDSTATLAAPSLLIVIVVSIISAVLGGLIYYFALIELENKTGKKILYTGIVTSIAISMVTSFYLADMLGELFGSISTGNSDYSLFPFTQNFGKIAILGIIPNLLFLYSFYIPYKRIKDGELVPDISSVGQEPFPSRLCPNCGRSIPYDANVCPYCSKKFEQ
jgi:MFS family permease